MAMVSSGRPDVVLLNEAKHRLGNLFLGIGIEVTGTATRQRGETRGDTRREGAQLYG
jgi:hypothetical protein